MGEASTVGQLAVRLCTEVGPVANDAIVSFLNSSCWCDLYESALFETDRSKLPERIADAEKAIVARARELFSMTTGYIEEVQAIEHALYALRTLQTCLELKAAG